MNQDVATANRSAWQVQRSVWFALFLRELKTRFGGRWLGAYWAVLEPLTHIILLMMIFGYARHRVVPGLDFPLFLLVGLIPYLMFKNLTLRGMDAIDANRGLLGYRQVKPIDPLIARAMLEVALYSVIYLIMLALMTWLDMTVLPAQPLELLGVSALILVFGFSLGLLCAVATDQSPKARSLIRISFMPLYLLSGILFPANALPAQLLPWLLWNPILHAIELSRGHFFIQYHVVHGVRVEYVAAWTIGTLVLALSLYRIRRHRLLAAR